MSETSQAAPSSIRFASAARDSGRVALTIVALLQYGGRTHSSAYVEALEQGAVAAMAGGVRGTQEQEKIVEEACDRLMKLAEECNDRKPLQKVGRFLMFLEQSKIPERAEWAAGWRLWVESTLERRGKVVRPVMKGFE